MISYNTVALFFDTTKFCKIKNDICKQLHIEATAMHRQEQTLRFNIQCMVHIHSS